MIASAGVSKPFFESGERMFSHGSTFGGHPVSAAVATANLDIIEREDLLGHVERHAPALRAGLEALAAASPIAGEVRGDGYFLALELLKDRDSRTPFPHAERDELISSRLLPLSRELGLHVKFDDRIELAVLLTPALVAGPAEHEEIVGKLELLLDAAAGRAKSRALSARS
jgi:adenosylmethionine-8-amino-7-oxononanoate aminotransferase